MIRISSMRLAPKLLLVFVPSFLIVAGVGIWQIMRYDMRVETERLTARIGNHAARASAALSRIDAPARPELARDLVSPLTADGAVECVELRTRGPAPESMIPGLSCAHASPGTHSMTLPVQGETEADLTLHFTDAEVVREGRARRNVMVAVLVLAAAVALLCGGLALRLVVGRRFRRLHAALARIAEGGQRVAVEAGPDDELGRIMASFNAMIDSEARREQALEKALDERHRTQAELERVNAELQEWIHAGESERRFRDFAASSSDWYWEMDADLRFSYFSDRFTEVTGVPNEALLGKTRDETGIPDVDPEAWAQHLDNLARRRPFRGFEHPRKKSSGETVWLSISGTPVFDSEERFLGYRGTGSDITERVRAKELTRAKEVSEQLAKTKGEFLANMSHEIRTPINGVLGMTELLLKTALDGRQRRFAESVRGSAESLLDVINDVLDFSKIEAGKLSLQNAAFDLRPLIEDIIESFAERAHRKGLELAAHVPPRMHRMYRGDPARMRQILTNLIGNAIKFTHEGEVVLRVQSIAERGTAVLRFDVEDTGIGIAPNKRAGIFESFAQGDGSTSREFGGTGLGLAICDQLVALMGGEIGVESEIGRGSTFWFRVPLPHEELSPTTREEGDALTGSRVLVVDDNPTNREILANQLASWRTLNDCAAGGEDALRMLRRAVDSGQPYDLVVVDMHMPEMNGLDLTRRIRSEPELRGPRLVLLSSICDSLDHTTLAAAGVERWLSKPVRQRELYDCLASVAAPGATHGEPGGRLAAADGPRSLQGRVLLVEDNLVNQEVALELLDGLGVQVEVAADGAEAVDAWASSSFDLVLMDCQMPHVNGYEATREIRRREVESSLPRIPIVAVTANAMHGDRERCLEAGMDDYLTKPFTEGQLHEVLGRWLSGPETEAAQNVGSGTAVHAPVADDTHVEVLDSTVLERYRNRERAGRTGLVARIVGSYLDQSIPQMESLRQAAATGDATTVYELAHTLKSSSAQVGASMLAERLRAVESAAREGSIDLLTDRVAAVDSDFALVCEALERELEGQAA